MAQAFSHVPGVLLAVFVASVGVGVAIGALVFWLFGSGPARRQHDRTPRPYKKPKSVTVFRVLPRVVHVQVDVAPSADVMVAAEAIRVLLMSYVSTNQMAVVEEMDLRPTVIKALQDAVHVDRGDMSDHEHDLMKERLDEGRY